MESRVNVRPLADGEFMRRFDMTMTYERHATVWCPYFGPAMAPDLLRPPLPKTATSPAVLFRSNRLDRSGRGRYVFELMKRVKVDSYGSVLRNRELPGPDHGRDTKLATLARYKFTLAFENSIGPDYVTEKFFDPLLAGSVPVYLGAPNVADFAPGPRCFINAADFSDPAALATYLNDLDQDPAAYAEYLAWKAQGLAPGFGALLDTLREPVFCRLCRALGEGGRPRCRERLPESLGPTPVTSEDVVPRRPPERAVVLACARARRDDETTHRLRRLLGQGTLDWPLLRRLALAHGLRPLVSWQLERCVDLVPAPVMRELRGDLQGNAARNVARTKQLARILSLLEAHRIEAMPHKGAALAMLAYGDVALRHFVDLDILVHKGDVLPAARLLAAFLDQHCEYALSRDGDGSSVRLHWEIVPPALGLPVATGWPWESTRSVSLRGQAILTPSPEDLLVILCVHGSKHLWNRLGWICDVAELIRAHPDLDWPRAVTRARVLGGTRMLRLGLWLAAELLEANLPPPVRDQIAADHRTRALGTRIGQGLAEGTVPPERSLAMLRLHLAMRERLRDKIRYGWRRAFTGTLEDWEAVPLPGSLFFLYGFLRPLRLARKHGRTILRGR